MRWQDKAADIWGERWRSVLALTLGINKRTVQRWDKADYLPAAADEMLAGMHSAWRSYEEGET